MNVAERQSPQVPTIALWFDHEEVSSRRGGKWQEQSWTAPQPSLAMLGPENQEQYLEGKMGTRGVCMCRKQEKLDSA